MIAIKIDGKGKFVALIVKCVTIIKYSTVFILPYPS